MSIFKFAKRTPRLESSIIGTRFFLSHGKSIRWADGFVLLFSISDLSSFEILPTLCEYIKQVRPGEDLAVTLVGTKGDQEYDREIPPKRAESFALELKASYIETSLPVRQNIESVFEDVARTILFKKRFAFVADLRQGKEIRVRVVSPRISGSVQVSSNPRDKKPSYKKQYLAAREGVLYFYPKKQDFQTFRPSSAEYLAGWTCDTSNLQSAKRREAVLELTGPRTETAERTQFGLQFKSAADAQIWAGALEEEIIVATSALKASKLPMPPDEDRRVRQLALFQDLVKTRTEEEFLETALPANEQCADCNSNLPDWISVNLGILVCMDCAAIHASSVGAPTTKPRSVILDRVDTPVMELAMALGNHYGNSLWEYSLDFAKPQPAIETETKRRFIQQKYVDKLFLRPLPLPTLDAIESILEEPRLCRLFRQHLEQEHATENLDFLLASRDVLSEATMDLASWEAVYNQFVAVNSPREVNLPAPVRRSFQGAHATPTLLRQAVETAVQEIKNMLTTDSLPRFRESPLYAQALSAWRSINLNRGLLRAAEEGDLRTAYLHLAHGANPNFRASTGRTPLMAAAAGGFDKLLLLLVVNGAESQVKDSAGNTASSLAEARRDAAFCVEILRRWTGKRHQTGLTEVGSRTKLHELASTSGDVIEAFRFVASKHTVTLNAQDADGCTALHYAASHCNWKILAYLLTQSKIDSRLLDFRGNSVLHLLAKGPPSPLQAEALHRLILLTNDLDLPNEKGESPLHVAVLHNNADVAKALLQANADANALDDSGSSPLHYAVSVGSLPCVDLLVSFGAASHAQPSVEGSPLELAERYSFPTIQRYLRNSNPSRPVAVDEPAESSAKASHKPPSVPKRPPPRTGSESMPPHSPSAPQNPPPPTTPPPTTPPPITPPPELYCICHTPYNPSKFMIACDRCEGWFHGDCVGLSPDQAVQLEGWSCPNCFTA